MKSKFIVTLLSSLFLAVLSASAQVEPTITLLTDSGDTYAAGSVFGIKYNSVGFAPGTLFVGLVPVNGEIDGDTTLVSQTIISADGNDGDATTLPFSGLRGDYNIVLIVTSDNYPKSVWAYRGTGVITVTSAITSPAQDSILRAGTSTTVTWGREFGATTYDVYLVEESSHHKQETSYIATVDAEQGSFQWSVPKNIKPGAYRLIFSAKGYGTVSDTFSIAHGRKP